MKKLKILLLFMFASFVMSMAFIQVAYADDSFDVTINFVVEADNLGSDPISSNVGDKLNITGLSEDDGYLFKFWIVNGVIRTDLSKDATFLATKGMELTMVYESVGATSYPVIFIDTNGHLVDEVVFIENGKPATIPNVSYDNFTKPGYNLVVDGEEPVFKKLIGSDLNKITEASVFVLDYVLTDLDNTVKINEVDYPYNSIVTLTSEEENFTAWVDANGSVLSYDKDYSFTALIDLEGIVESTDPHSEAPLVSFLDVTGIREGMDSYLGQYYLPEGYEFIEAGFVMDNELVPSNSFNPVTNEFLRTSASKDDVKAYLTYLNDGTVTTIYSKNVKKTIIYDVTFDSNEGSLVSPVQVNHGEKISKPIDPTKDMKAFDGWYKDSALTIAWDFENDVVTNDMTLYAKWKDLPKLKDPFGSVDNSPEGILIGAYGVEEGHSGSFEWVAHNIQENKDYIYIISNDPWFRFSSLNPKLPVGNYTLKVKAIATTNPRTHLDSDYHNTPGFEIKPIAISKPVLDLDSLNMKVSWNNVSNASSYDVEFNGETYTNQTSPFDFSSYVSELVAGTYPIKVTAKGNAGYGDSFATVNYIVTAEAAEKLASPTGLREEDGILSWNAVSNAVSYKITMDGVTKTASLNSFDLSQFFKAGTFNVTVVAVGDGVSYLDSDPSDPLKVTIEVELTPLESLTAGDLQGEGGGLVNTHGANDHRNLVWHASVTEPGGHLNQNGNADGVRITVYDSDGTTELANTIVTGSGTSWHISGADPFAQALQEGNIVHLQVNPSAQGIENGFTYSEPLIYTLKG